MHIINMKYVDYNGETREEEFRFNLSPAEVYLIQNSKNGGGVYELLEKMINNHDVASLIAYVKELLLMSYGVKSQDGRNFRKSKEIRDDFESTAAFSEIYMSLVTDEEAAIKFVNETLPSKEAMDKYSKMMEIANQKLSVSESK